MPDAQERPRIPERLRLNAWAGRAVSGRVSEEGAVAWALSKVVAAVPPVLMPARLDLTNWNSPEVGWGLILPQAPRSSLFSPAVFESPRGAPEPIRRLVKSRRNAPVFRYLGGSATRPYAVLLSEATGSEIEIDGAPRGTAPGALPQYLLIYGTPEDIPWRLQYTLSTNRCVGRLDLKDQELDNYVTHLISGWTSAQTRPEAPLVWAVDDTKGEDPYDITSLMRSAIAEPLFREFQRDAELTAAHFVDGSREPATARALLDALASRRPAFVATTGHGQTEPLEDKTALAAGLGRPVDEERRALGAAEVLSAWEPDGAIWYSHACCSAGGDAQSVFDGLFQAEEDAARVLKAVAGLGSTGANFPKALLGARKPLRAFIGHVEPTFDMTLKNLDAPSQPVSTAPLIEALYRRLFAKEPVGLALEGWYRRISTLDTLKQRAQEAFDRGEDTEGQMLYYQLSARDIQALVILGDPTVAFAGSA